MKRIVKIVDVEAGTEEIIERDETAVEKLEREEFERNSLILAEINAKQAAAKAVLLERLGITEEEAKLLLG